MENNVYRVMLCFAALDIDEDELHKLIDELRSMTWREISKRVTSLRRHAMHYRIDKDKMQSSTKRSPTHSHDASVGERVERLLKSEAGLTTAQAVEKLASQLDELGFVERQNVPPLSRKSLCNWVNRLVQRVPEKDILRCATIVRNEYVHRPITDWALKGSLK
jgi:hypothetical protein